MDEPVADDGFEVAELVRDVGDAVGLEYQPRAQLPSRPRNFLLGKPLLAHAFDGLAGRRVFE